MCGRLDRSLAGVSQLCRRSRWKERPAARHAIRSHLEAAASIGHDRPLCPARPDIPPENDPLQSCGATRLFPGLLRYYDLTGDGRALEAAKGLAERLWMARDEWRRMLKSPGDHGFYAWVSEGFARLYPFDQDSRWLEFCGMIRDSLPTCTTPCSAHAMMSTLRGLQMTALADRRSLME